MLKIILKKDRDLENSLAKICEAMVRRVSNTLQNASIEAYMTAKQSVPIRTGKLYDSIRLEKRGDYEFRIVAGYPTRQKGKPYYAPFVEFGTRRMAPRPFMKPAVERALAKIKSSL